MGRARTALQNARVATALIALSNGFAIERLADPAAAPDDLFAHAIAALLRGYSKPADGALSLTATVTVV